MLVGSVEPSAKMQNEVAEILKCCCKNPKIVWFNQPDSVQLLPSKHLKGHSVPRVKSRFCSRVSKGFFHFPVSRHFSYSRDFVIFLFLDTFRIQGILSFSCFQTLSVFKDYVVSAVSRHFLSVFKDRAERRRREARRV